MNYNGDDLRGLGLVVVAGACTYPGSIAEQVAEEALARGAKVVVVGPAGCDAMAGRLAEAEERSGVEPGRVSFVALAAPGDEQIDGALDAVFEALPDAHVLVNVLGHASDRERRLLGDTTLADWNAALAAWLRTPFLVTRRALDEFLSRGEGGRIVHIMPAVEAGEAGLGPRLAAQRALTAFIRTVAKEYGRRRISCNGVAVPGEVVLQAGAHPARGHAAVAEAALFLASEDASFVNGEVLRVA